MRVTGKSSSGTQQPLYTWTLGDLLPAVLIAFFGIYILLMQNSASNKATKVFVRKDGTQLSTFSLDVDSRVDLNQFGVNMVLEVKDGRIRVVSSDCKQQLCVRHGWIEHPREAIFCLPNHTTIELSGDGAQYDAISR